MLILMKFGTDVCLMQYICFDSGKKCVAMVTANYMTKFRGNAVALNYGQFLTNFHEIWHS